MGEFKEYVFRETDHRPDQRTWRSAGGGAHQSSPNADEKRSPPPADWSGALLQVTPCVCRHCFSAQCVVPSCSEHVIRSEPTPFWRIVAGLGAQPYLGRAMCMSFPLAPGCICRPLLDAAHFRRLAAARGVLGFRSFLLSAETALPPNLTPAEHLRELRPDARGLWACSCACRLGAPGAAA